MQNKSVTKILLWIFTVWIVFLWLNVFAADCSYPPKTLDDTWDACEQYGTWYVFNNWCCVLDCKKSGKMCTKTWEKLNPDTCKCECDSSIACCWVKLNTVVPFIWDCIEMTTMNDPNSSSRTWTVTVNQLNAFPFLMQWLMKILITAILIFSIIIVIVAWLMMTVDPALNTYKKWTTMLKNVIISLILLWCSWLILKLINPSFFGG